MPLIYENDGHRRRMMRMYPQFAWKMLEWRKDPHCRTCGVKTHIHYINEKAWKRQATVDHVLSRGNGGPDEESNYQLLCGKCNNDKSKTENPSHGVKTKKVVDISSN